MEKLKLIIYREFLTKVRNKSFIVLTFLSPFLIIAIGLLIAYLTKVNDSGLKEIVIINNSKLDFSTELYNTETVHYIDLKKVGLVQSKALVEKGTYDGLLYIPKMEHGLKELSESIYYYSLEAPNFLLIRNIENKVANILKFRHLELNGIQAETIKEATYTISIQQVDFSGGISSKLGSSLKIGLGMAAGYLIMMFIVIYGTSVMRSVIEEKVSRIIEVIISSVKPFQLLMGKIIGNASAGLLQFFIWGALLLVFSFAVSYFFGIDLMTINSPGLIQSDLDLSKEELTELTAVLKEILDLPLVMMFFMFIFYFIGGFFLYSSIYAAIGAAVDSETDTQQFMMPVILPLILGVYVGFVAVVSDPHGPVATIFSILPITSPIVMMMRIPFGVPWYEILISMLLLVITFLAVVLLAAKIYKVGILMYGKKASYKDLYKWLKY
ncbi:ABC transporter permease [Flavicella sp.]|uniref:ABC transporter permease n=1 Tax=Flavicella sp. TaxID=2957742 RepID=UPI00301A0CD6